MVWNWLRSRRRAADERAAELLEELRAAARSTPHEYVVYVTSVYQRARRGTKAMVEVEGVGTRDAWFWRSTVTPGQMLLVSAHRNWGAHSHRRDVFYVGTDSGPTGVHRVMSAKTARRAARHLRRVPVSR